MHDASPAVTIVLPTYNGERFIRQALASCLKQSHPDLELIVVDDASTDATPAIVASYDDPRVIVVRNPTNLRLPMALNAGFAQARGAYLTWMADDDLLAPDAIEVLATFLDQRPDVDAAYADYARMDEEGNLQETVHVKSLDRIRDEAVSSQSFMYRRHVYQALGGYAPAWFLVEDYEFWLRAWSRFTVRHVPTDRPLYYFRQRPESLTGRFRYRALRLAVQVRCGIFQLSPAEVRRQLAQVDVHQAFECYRNQDWRSAYTLALQGIARWPAWFKNRGVRLILVRSFVRTLFRA